MFWRVLAQIKPWRTLTPGTHWLRSAWMRRAVGVGDTAKCGIDPIPSKYRASIADTDSNTDTFYFEKQLIYFCVGESNAS